LICTEPGQFQFSVAGIAKLGLHAEVEVHNIGITIDQVSLKGTADISAAAGPSAALIRLQSIPNAETMKPGGRRRLDALEGDPPTVRKVVRSV
jgi:hypothetical protein